MAILLDLIPHYFFNLESLPDSKWITMLLLGLAMGFRNATDAPFSVASPIITLPIIYANPSISLQ